MSILLACITDRCDLALQAAQLISRSHVPVNIRRVSQPFTADYPVGPFEIILLSDIDINKPSIRRELTHVISRFKRNRTLRYWVMHDAQIFSPLFKRYQYLADTISRELDRTCISQPDSIDKLIVHCLLQSAPAEPAASGQLPIIHAAADGSLDFYQSHFNSVIAASPLMQQMIVLVKAQEDIIGLVRGIEKCRLMAGIPQLALHLPALFRIRGYLNSVHQIINKPDCLISLADNKKPIQHHSFVDWSCAEKQFTLSPETDNRTSGYRWVLTLPDLRAMTLFLEHPDVDFVQLRDPSISAGMTSVARLYGHLIELNIPAGTTT